MRTLIRRLYFIFLALLLIAASGGKICFVGSLSASPAHFHRCVASGADRAGESPSPDKDGSGACSQCSICCAGELLLPSQISSIDAIFYLVPRPIIVTAFVLETQVADGNRARAPPA